MLLARAIAEVAANSGCGACPDHYGLDKITTSHWLVCWRFKSYDFFKTHLYSPIFIELLLSTTNFDVQWGHVATIIGVAP